MGCCFGLKKGYRFQEVIRVGPTKFIEPHTCPSMWQTLEKHVSKSHVYCKFLVFLVAIEIGVTHKNVPQFMYVHQKIYEASSQLGLLQEITSIDKV